MRLLPKWTLTNPMPSIHDTESGTAIEMVAKVYGAMNTLIEEYNQFADEVNKQIIEYNEDITKDNESFKKCITETIETYIKSIDMKIDEQDLKIDKAILYMKDNIVESTNELVNQAIEEGKIVIYEDYDSANESLNLIVTGGV